MRTRESASFSGCRISLPRLCASKNLTLSLRRNYQLGFPNMGIYALDLLAHHVRVALPSCTVLVFRLLLYVLLMVVLYLQNLLSVIWCSVLPVATLRIGTLIEILSLLAVLTLSTLPFLPCSVVTSILFWIV